MPLKDELIYINGKNETDRIASFSYRGDKYAIIFKGSDKEYLYGQDKAKIVKSGISDNKALNIFNYLKKIADVVGVKTDDGKSTLTISYEKISFIPEDSILANYLNGKIPLKNKNNRLIDIFPFGFNLSQKDAVNEAFSSSLSVIEGPPGTGKTQTILNIIANAVMNGQSVAVVSNNNSTTQNVYEKLEKNGIGFIAALLGNRENREKFIDLQSDVPDLSNFNLLVGQKAVIKENALLEDKATVENQSVVCGCSVVRGNARITGMAHISDNTLIEESALVVGKSCLSGNTIVRGKAFVGGYAQLSDNALVCGEAVIEGNMRLSGNAYVEKGHFGQGEIVDDRDFTQIPLLDELRAQRAKRM